MQRVTYIRLSLALAGACVVGCGLWLEMRWLTAAGLATSACAEILGQAVIRVASNSPALRLAEAAAEALPAVGIALVVPEAMLVAVAVVVRPLVCGAIETVLVSRGLPFRETTGALRRTLTAAANLGLVVTGAAQLGMLALRVDFGRHLLWTAVGLACAASIGAIVRDWLTLRSR